MAVAVRSVLWLRRDLRLHDHPALNAAADQGQVLALFVVDPVLMRSAGLARTTYLLRTLASLRADLRAAGGDLTVRVGSPEDVVPRVVDEIGASAVHVSGDFAPYGVRRDARVEDRLGAVPLIRTGSPYAVEPGEVRTKAGSVFQVFGPFFRAWTEHGWEPPAPDGDDVDWLVADSDPLPGEPEGAGELVLPPAGEAAALETWASFRRRSTSYEEGRDRLDEQATTELSPHLKWGTIHPRTLLASLSPDDHALLRQFAWREFFASALHANPTAAREPVRQEFRAFPWVRGQEERERFTAWREGMTGYPVVDAAMRQLAAEGWIHNRARMIAASFLVKDLGVDWTVGSDHFMQHLIDGDVANNQLSWQWVAGTGFDAAPYFRIMNPLTQSRKFDPDGTYLRRWLPELRGLDATEIHQPWTATGGLPNGYPSPIVDHAEQRESMLAAYSALRR